MKLLKTPLSGKLLSAQLVPHLPWKMTLPPSRKTFDLYQGVHVLLGRGRELGSARGKKRQTMDTV